MIGTAPAISIIMPCYNAAEHLSNGISSIFGQTFEDWELIVVDDGSRDATLALLNQYADPRMRVISQENRGVSAARNLGLQHARAPLVAFLDSDDKWSPVFLERMHAVLHDHPDIGLVYCGWQNVGVAAPRGNPFVPPDYEKPNKLELLLPSTRWPIHACMTRRDLVTAAGGFDARFAVGEDFLLWLEIASFHQIRLVPEVLAFYIHHGGVQATRDRIRAAHQLRQVQSVFLDRHPEVITKLGTRLTHQLTDGVLLKRAYEAYWRRDLDTAQPIFRMAFKGHAWKIHDLRFMLPALLPPFLFRNLVRFVDLAGRATGVRK